MFLCWDEIGNFSVGDVIVFPIPSQPGTGSAVGEQAMYKDIAKYGENISDVENMPLNISIGGVQADPATPPYDGDVYVSFPYTIYDLH